jgi:activating signal cointegrator complex subunit 3
MVFVHARNATVRTAEALRDLARSHNHLGHFAPEQTPLFGLADKQVRKKEREGQGGRERKRGGRELYVHCVLQVQRSRNKQLRDLFGDGFSIHHAGMLRQDRSLVERLFSEGLIKVLVCTATLAWGVNLPAHAVIIKVHMCVGKFCPSDGLIILGYVS